MVQIHQLIDRMTLAFQSLNRINQHLKYYKENPSKGQRPQDLMKCHLNQFSVKTCHNCHTRFGTFEEENCFSSWSKWHRPDRLFGQELLHFQDVPPFGDFERQKHGQVVEIANSNFFPLIEFKFYVRRCKTKCQFIIN